MTDYMQFACNKTFVIVALIYLLDNISIRFGNVFY